MNQQNGNRIYRNFYSVSDIATGKLIAQKLNKTCELVTTYIGRFQINLHKSTEYTKLSSPSVGIFLIGYAIDPINKYSDQEKIVKKLYDSLSKSFSSFFDYLDNLSGAFVLLYRVNEDVFLLQDPCATKLAYYLSDDDAKICVTSHIYLFDLLGIGVKNEDAVTFYTREDYSREISKYLPGSLTKFENVQPVFANTFYDFKNQKLSRFYPRKPLLKRELDSSLVEEVAEMLTAQLKLVNQIGKMAIAATGGKDSRVTLAAAPKAHSSNCAFTFWNSSTEQFLSDVNIARQLCQKIDLEHHIYDLKQSSDEIHKFMPFRSPMGIWPGAAAIYLRYFDDETVHIRSTVSEVGRCFYNRHRGSSEISGSRLAATYTRQPIGKSEFLSKIFERYIETTEFRKERIFNFDPLDLFYWEHRNTKWQAVLCHEAEIVGRVFIPFNNRKILELFLSIPDQQRQSAELHKKLISYLQHTFDDIPVDSEA